MRWLGELRKAIGEDPTPSQTADSTGLVPGLQLETDESRIQVASSLKSIRIRPQRNLHKTAISFMFNLMPRDTVFFDLFDQLAEHAISAARQLQDMAGSFPEVDRHIQEIRDLEHAADALAHAALERLDRTFITPFDREDIHTLVGELDDIIDSIDFLAKRFTLYHFQSIESDFQRQTEVLVRAVTALKPAVFRLRNSRKLSDFAEDLKTIGRLEKEGDDINHSAVSRLFSNGADALNVMKWKEFYDRIERAIDGCEDVGNIIERIVLKNG
jgi:predicted phosphate transport protein (TIGR00153 family)